MMPALCPLQRGDLAVQFLILVLLQDICSTLQLIHIDTRTKQCPKHDGH